MDEDAELAYQTVTLQNSITNNLDDEFDYDENAFKIIPKVIEPKEPEENQTCSNENLTENTYTNGEVDSVSVATENCVNPDTIENGVSHVSSSETDIVQFSNLENITDCGEPKAFGVDTNVLHKEHVHSEDVEEWKEAQRVAAEQWSQVEEVIGVEASDASSGPTLEQSISFSEAFQHYHSLDLSEHRTKIRPCVQPSGLAALCYSFTGPAKISSELVEDRDFIFTLALLPFQEEKIGKSILNSVYKGLTKAKADCPRFGKHWEAIGFQGNDPATDLRGCGMLGLLTILHFITSERSGLANMIYSLSLDEVQNFPFCVMSINVTRIALQILREGKLNKECNKRFKAKKKSANYALENNMILYELFQEIYVAIFNKIYLVWKNEYKTMAESGFVMKDVETYSLKNPLKLLETLKGQKIVACDKEKLESFVGVEEC